MLVSGLIAGAAGTIALDATAYLDMVVRGRPPSDTPGRTARTLAGRVGIDLDENRASAVGALLGYATGLGIGAVFALLNRGRLRPPTDTIALTALVLGAANGPMTALGVTDPRRWSAVDWLADLVPHIAYGVVGAAVLRQLTATRASRARQ